MKNAKLEKYTKLDNRMMNIFSFKPFVENLQSLEAKTYN